MVQNSAKARQMGAACARLDWDTSAQLDRAGAGLPRLAEYCDGALLKGGTEVAECAEEFQPHHRAREVPHYECCSAGDLSASATSD